MSAVENLRDQIAQEAQRLRASISDGESAALALVGRLGASVGQPSQLSPTALVLGAPVARSGANRALAFALASAREDAQGRASVSVYDAAWSANFLDACDGLVLAESIVDLCDTGFMRAAEAEGGEVDVWIVGRRQPAAWRERQDFAWLAQRARQRVPATSLGPGARDSAYQELAAAIVETMGYQFGYPAEATVGGVQVQVYGDVLALLIGWSLQARDRGDPVVSQPEHALAERVSRELGLDSDLATNVLGAFTLDWSNACDHAAVAGIASAPLVRVGPDVVMLSSHGLLAEPFIFLARELRRRDSQSYNNAAMQREQAFRADLASLFADRRFSIAPRRVDLRREKGELRTDIDAMVFDRKTGTLGVFELKSQDPFVRSNAERQRQRDNVLYANRQVAGVLAWIKQHSATDLVARFDARAAKTFKANKVVPFVLGRYLVHFPDGPEPDPRAAWGTWPQVLRLLDRQPIGANDANPIFSLFNRLRQDSPLERETASDVVSVVTIGSLRVTVYPSFAAYRAALARGT